MNKKTLKTCLQLISRELEKTKTALTWEEEANDAHQKLLREQYDQLDDLQAELNRRQQHLVTIEELRELFDPDFVINQGVHTIRRIRQITGAGLKEAKDLRDELKSRHETTSMTMTAPEPSLGDILEDALAQHNNNET